MNTTADATPRLSLAQFRASARWCDALPDSALPESMHESGWQYAGGLHIEACAGAGTLPRDLTSCLACLTIYNESWIAPCDVLEVVLYAHGVGEGFVVPTCGHDVGSMDCAECDECQAIVDADRCARAWLATAAAPCGLAHGRAIHAAVFLDALQAAPAPAVAPAAPAPQRRSAITLPAEFHALSATQHAMERALRELDRRVVLVAGAALANEDVQGWQQHAARVLAAIIRDAGTIRANLSQASDAALAAALACPRDDSAHDELVAALRMCQTAFEGYRSAGIISPRDGAMEIIRAALAKAGAA